MKIALPILTAFLCSMLVSAFLTWGAWQDNLDGDAHDGDTIYYDFLLGVFGVSTAMIMGFISPFLIGWLFHQSRANQRRS